MTVALDIRDVHASVEGSEILRGVDLEVPFGEIHVIMGPNGSGKSTLSHVLTGHPAYEVTGSARLAGTEILGLDIDERARLGLLQAFQYPTEVPGIHLAEFVREAAEERGLDPGTVDARASGEAKRFGMEAFLDRSLNDDLSGGEKKRSEIFQIAVLEPKVAILDEIDSGLDIDAVRQVAEAVEAMRGPDVAILMITHYARILRYLSPDRIHVMLDGRIVESGGPQLATDLEKGGYEAVRTRLGLEPPRSEEPAIPKASDFFTDTPFDR
ncbi:MAG TPA: Fe-S cluster assembly ATPase SufC [Acidimicrobiia bacterium]|nr:Fe-S cluster assembly ATPase SufC [Acidimicrobiia bacterium]